MGIFVLEGEVMNLEITLFNKKGMPEAYIKEQDQTIFHWDGKVAAYIEQDHVYSWEGVHIGWYEDDIIFDLEGYKVGSTKWACPTVTAYEPDKARKLQVASRGQSVRSDYKKILKNSYKYDSLKSYLDKF